MSRDDDDLAGPVRRFWRDVWSRGDVDVLDEIVASDARENGAEVIVAEFKQGVASWREMFADFTATIEELLVIDDRVITRVTFRGTHVASWGVLPASGKRIEGMGIDIFRLRDGRIVELWHAVDHLPIVRQIGGAVRSADLAGR